MRYTCDILHCRPTSVVACRTSARNCRGEWFLGGDNVLYLNIGPPYPLANCACSLWSCSVASGRDRLTLECAVSSVCGADLDSVRPFVASDGPCSVGFGDAPFFNKTTGASPEFVQGTGILLVDCVVGPRTEMKHVV